MELQIYLSFNGNCEEALNFYKNALKGEIIDLTRYEGSPMMVGDADKQKILHSTFKFDGGTFMAADNTQDNPVTMGNNIWLTISSRDLNFTEKTFELLSEKGKVTMPLQDTYWGARFGMLIDKFGVGWMFNCQLKEQPVQ
jgi:PhnB protein